MSQDLVMQRHSIDQAVADQTLCGAFARTLDRHGQQVALRWRGEDGWRSLAWGDYGAEVRALSLGLHALALVREHSVGMILARNGPRHVIADLALVHARALPVTAYNTSSRDQLSYMIEHSQATVVFIESEFLDRLPPAAPVTLVVMDLDHADGDGRFGWLDVTDAGWTLHRSRPSTFAANRRRVRPDDPATLVYTSGTSGPPKGVIQTHRSALWTLESLGRVEEVGSEDHLVSYLPLAHSAERWWSHWRGVLTGAQTSFCNDPDLLLPTLLDARPTWFLGVPRVWEKMHVAIATELAAIADSGRRELIERALELASLVVRHEQEGRPPPAALRSRHDAVRPMLASILQRIGLDRCRVACTGSAPISADVLEFFHALGLRVSEGWGMTEMMIGTWNGTGRIKIGTVGVPLPGVEACLADDGELLVRGGNVMAGYHKDEAATSAVLGPDGWLHTGDVATVDDDGYYRIIDRKKELIITAGGMNVSAANLEALLMRHPLVDQACVVGDRRPFLVALVVLGAGVSTWGSSRGIEAASPEEMARHPLVVAEIDLAVAAVNEKVSRPEQIKRYRIIPERWSVGGGELTATLKLKRRVVLSRHAALIDEIYATGQ